MEQKELVIKNNDFNIVVRDKNKNTEEIQNINTLLKKENVFDLVGFMKFKYSYFYITDELSQDPKTACDLILNNTLSFDRRIPLHQINNIYGLNIDSTNKDIQKAVTKYLNNTKEYIYYCNDRTDKYVAILYHFLTNGFYLRECTKCGNLYFRDKNQTIYCDDCKNMRNEEIKEEKKEKRKAVSQEIYEKEFNALRGMLKNHQDKISDYDEILKNINTRISLKRKDYRKEIITKEQLNKFSLELHEEIRKFIKEVSK